MPYPDFFQVTFSPWGEAALWEVVSLHQALLNSPSPAGPRAFILHLWFFLSALGQNEFQKKRGTQCVTSAENEIALLV